VVKRVSNENKTEDRRQNEYSSSGAKFNNIKTGNWKQEAEKMKTTAKALKQKFRSWNSDGHNSPVLTPDFMLSILTPDSCLLTSLSCIPL
jgi:hypothetical protein